MLRIWHKLKITSNERRRQNRLQTSYPFILTSFLFGVLFLTFSFFCNAFGIECVAVLRKFAHAWKHSTELSTKTIVCYAIIAFSCGNFSFFFQLFKERKRKAEAQIAIFFHSRCNFCILYIRNWRLRFENMHFNRYKIIFGNHIIILISMFRVSWSMMNDDTLGRQ